LADFPTPSVVNIEEAALSLSEHQNFVIMTGAGLSAGCGIPTFRGEGGFWTIDNEKHPAEDIVKYSFFKENPGETWKWHHHFNRLKKTCKPSASHYALGRFHQLCTTYKLSCTMATQNIDGFDVAVFNDLNKDSPIYCESIRKAADEHHERFGLNVNIREMHGNTDYMRCEHDCSNQLYRAPDPSCDDYFVPTCPKCGDRARPHCLFFDETYRDEFYQTEGLKEAMESCGALIIIGTALQTNLASKIAHEACNRGTLVMEINPDPVLKYGNVKCLIAECDSVVPDLVQNLENLWVQFNDVD